MILATVKGAIALLIMIILVCAARCRPNHVRGHTRDGQRDTHAKTRSDRSVSKQASRLGTANPREHESLQVMTPAQLAQPFVRGDSLIIGEQGIPCSQGFCP